MNRLFNDRPAVERQPQPNVQSQFRLRPPRDRDAGLTDAQVIARDWFGERGA